MVIHNNRLQFVRAENTFTTRDEAINYIQRRGAKLGEPVVALYGNSTDPNLILGIGSVESPSTNKYFIIDLGKVNEDINNLESSIGDLKDLVNDSQIGTDELLDALTTKVGNVIMSLGVNSDGTYKPHYTDPYLNGVENAWDADKTLSEKLKELKDGIENGAIKTTPKVSEKNGNIIRVEHENISTDGIYASVELEFDPLTEELVFKRAGFDDVRIPLALPELYQDSGYNSDTETLWITMITHSGTKTIEIPVKDLLDEWVPAENSEETIDQSKSSVILKKVRNTDANKDLLYADIKISDESVVPHNVLKKGENGHLFVNGNSSNLFYDETSVTLKEKIDEIISTAVSNFDNAKEYADTKAGEVLDDAKEYADTKAGEALHDAKVHTNIELTELDGELRDYVDTKAIDTLGSAKTYVDDKIGDINPSTNVKQYVDTKASDTLDSAKTYADGKLVEAKTYTDGEVDDAKTYADGKLVEAKTYSNDKFIEGKDYTDTKAGETLVSAKSYTDSEVFSKIGNINPSTNVKQYVDTKASDTLDSAKTYADDKVSAGVDDAKLHADNKLVEAKGYTDNKVVEAKGYTDNKVGLTLDEAKAYATLQDNALEDSLKNRDVLYLEYANNYTDDKMGNAISTSKDYTDNTVSNAITNLDTQVTANINLLEGYVDGQNLYYKGLSEDYADNKFDIEKNERIEVDGQLQSQINDLNTKSVVGEDSNTLTVTTTIDGSNTKVKGDVKISSDGNNIMSTNSDGLYATIDLDYDENTGKLLLTTSNGLTKSVDIALKGLIESASYNSANRSIVIVFKNSAGETQPITIDLAELVQEWEVTNTVLDTHGKLPSVQLTKYQTSDGGKDKLGADIIRLEVQDNILQKENNGALYVKGTGDNIKYDNVSTNTVIAHENVQDALTDLDSAITSINTYINTLTGFDFTEMLNDINSLNTRVTNVEANYNVISSDIATIKANMITNSNSIASNTSDISDLKSRVTTLEGRVNTMDTSINTLNTNVTSLGNRVDNVEGKEVISGAMTPNGNQLILTKRDNSTVPIDMTQMSGIASLVLDGTILTLNLTNGQSLDVDFKDMPINAGQFTGEPIDNGVDDEVDNNID